MEMTAVEQGVGAQDAAEPPPTYLPASVAAALRLLAVPESVVPACAADAEVVPREMSDARLSVHRLVMADHRVGDVPHAWVEEELRLLEAVEQVKGVAGLPGAGGTTAAPGGDGRAGSR